MCQRTEVDNPRLGVGIQERGKQENRKMEVGEDVDPEL